MLCTLYGRKYQAFQYQYGGMEVDALPSYLFTLLGNSIVLQQKKPQFETVRCGRVTGLIAIALFCQAQELERVKQTEQSCCYGSCCVTCVGGRGGFLAILISFITVLGKTFQS